MMGPESLGRHAKQCALLAGHAALWWSDPPLCVCADAGSIDAAGTRSAMLHA